MHNKQRSHRSTNRNDRMTGMSTWNTVLQMKHMKMAQERRILFEFAVHIEAHTDKQEYKSRKEFQIKDTVRHFKHRIF